MGVLILLYSILVITFVVKVSLDGPGECYYCGQRLPENTYITLNDKAACIECANDNWSKQ